MAYYWPQYGVAIEVDDDPYLLPFDEEAFPDAAVYHVTTDVICDPESFSALAHHIAHIHDIKLDPNFDELIYSRRLMLHMLFGADPSTFARRSSDLIPLRMPHERKEAVEPPRVKTSKKARRCLPGHRLRPYRRRPLRLAVKACRRDRCLGHSGGG